MRAPISKTEPIYQLKITLDGLRPPVWRRVLVPATIKLDLLHEIIQNAMGWLDCHLHLFEIGGVMYSIPSEDDELGMEDERRVSLKKALLKVGSKIKYVYDYGDSWRHTILLEKVLPREEGTIYPRCVAGKRACPPEDVGGTWGYQEFIEAMADPEHEDHDDMLEWVGDEFDPAAFDLERNNARLGTMKL